MGNYSTKVWFSFRGSHQFAFSTYVASEHGWAWGIPATLLAMLTAYSRINDNQHWLHDVVAGATIGAAYGYGINYLQHHRGYRRALNILPIFDHDKKGAVCVIEF